MQISDNAYITRLTNSRKYRYSMSLTGNIFDIKKYAIHDGPGIRTTVFFMGCSLDCKWCHNPECRYPMQGKRIGCKIDSSAVMDEIVKDILFYDESGGGVTFSGGEPMMQIEFLEELLQLCTDHDIHTAVDTSGYAPKEDFKRLLKHVDLFLFDIKIIDDMLHKEQTGVSNDLIHENLNFLSLHARKIIIRIPLIPGLTDSSDNLNDCAEFLATIPGLEKVSLLPYNRFGEDKSRRFNLDRKPFKGETQDDSVLEEKKKILEAFGFKVQIGG